MWPRQRLQTNRGCIFIKTVIIDAHTHPSGPSVGSIENYETMGKLMLEKPAESERVESTPKLMNDMV